MKDPASETKGVAAWHIAARITPLGLEADLDCPPQPKGTILFAHGSGSSRLSPRNRYVAAALRDRGLATLLFDLLTPGEAADRRLVFDIALLAERLAMATRWLQEEQESLRLLPLGYFGASTGAAAALVAAAAPECPVAAVVSRGGRPDLAGPALPLVRAPTLLVVGSNDVDVLALNRAALAEMRCPKSLAIVPGATHLFEEPGTLDQVIGLAANWFVDHLTMSTVG